jgi:putative DNA primase/helicase
MTKQQVSITLAAAAEALQYVSPVERATRVRMGESLRDEWGDDAFDAWDTWYQRHDRYTAAEAKSAWKSFGKGGSKRCTIGTLIYEAKRGGWRQTSRHAEKLDDAQRQEREAKKIARREADARAEAEANAAAAERAAKAWTAAKAGANHPYLERKAVKNHGLRVADEWVKEWVDDDGVVHQRAYKHALLVPIYAGPGRLASLQAIFPTRCIGRAPKDGERDTRRDKDYLRDGRKSGCYFPIGAITADTAIILVCEGYATGATLHELTGHPVMVAFDAGNLGEVARMLRDKLPGAKLVVCADNDAFTKRPDGSPWNPGVECAQAAAKDVAGVVATPTFKSTDGEPTDWNDLAAREGVDEVRRQFELVLNPPPVAKAEPADKDGATDDEIESKAFFTVLGYDHGRYFIFQHEQRQIMVYTKGDFSDSGFIELAPLNWWEMNFPAEKGGIERKTAMDWLVRLAAKRGIYDISRIRGRGAWQDNGRMVYHHGGHLTIDGVPTEVTRIVSRYVYEMDRSLPEPAAEPMTGDEGEMLLDVAGRFRWSKPGSAALLCGWVALAPLCGALKWRPHIWLTGGAGCGKSTVLNDFVHVLMNGCDLFAQGSSSEAGIRQSLKADALPVLFDESEKNTERERQRMDGIMALIRQSSTESQARTLKGTAGGESMSFHIRSMFCLASIQVGMEHQADVERLAVLSLRPKREDPNPEKTWAHISSGLRQVMVDETLPARLLRRSLDLLPITLKNIKVFSDVATRVFGSVRDGDQYGTMLAGAWSLTSDRVASPAEAEAMIAGYDWSEHRDSSDSDESERALAALLESHIRLQGGAEVTVYELVRSAAGLSNSGTEIKEVAADSVLQRYGMKVLRRAGEPRLVLSNSSQELRRLVAGSPFEADLRGLLLRLPGADRADNRPQRFNGVPAKCISLSLAAVLGETGAAETVPSGEF